MVHSLGLTLYNLRPGRAAQEKVAWPPRPIGALVWLHAPTAAVAHGLIELATRLTEEDGLPILLTCPEALPPLPGMIALPPPEDTPTQVRAFLDHWRPAMGLFSDGELRPALLHEAAERALPLLLVDARKPYLLPAREGWYPGLIRSTLQSFAEVLAMDDTAARAFRRAGAARVRTTGRLEEDSPALSLRCLEAERAALARLLATRPVWLAAGLPEAEETAILTAHRAAQSRAHRLLLIIAPEDPARAPEMAARLSEREGFVVASRAEDEEPEPEVEIFVADGMAEMGLWYRLAPITFMGGSLAGKGCLRNPMEPAALGSAILYGTRPGAYGSIFGRLGAARAARAVGSAGDLGEALADLLSPDKTARLAQAAWVVASDGAEVTEEVMARVRQITAGAG